MPHDPVNGNRTLTFLVGSQLAQHTDRNSLDVFDLAVEQLHESGDDVEAANDLPIVRIFGQSVQRAHGTLDNLLHADAVGQGDVLATVHAVAVANLLVGLA